jgi:acyl carrier protein
MTDLHPADRRADMSSHQPPGSTVTTSNASLEPDGEFARRLASFIGTDLIGGAGPVSTDTDLLTTGLVDSLGVIMVVDLLERELDTVIDPGDVVLEHFSSVDAILTFLRTR